MRAADIVLEMLGDTGTRYADVGEMLGVTDRAIGNKITRNAFRMQEFLDIADELGYDVIVKKRD